MKCRSCGSANLRAILDLGVQPWGNDYVPFDKAESAGKKYSLCFILCMDCKMAQIDSTIPKEVMFINHTYVSGTTASLKRHFVDMGKQILNAFPVQKGQYVLDIGGNDGTFLEYFHENGIDVLNVDSGILQSQISNSKGITCLNQFFNSTTAREIVEKKGRASIIHGSGILFHLEELHDAFKGIQSILAPDGVLVAEYIYLYEMMKNCAYDQIYHEHLVYYSLTTFQRLLDQFDLEIFDAELRPIHGGSCISYVAHKGTRKRTERYLQLQAKEIEDGMDKLETYLAFHDRVEQNKEKLVQMIRELRAAGKTVQALGAPVKGSTIINYCKLTENDIERGVEINPYKFNTYFPGTRIPVYDQKASPEPDVYLLLAWNFKDEILPKLQAFRDRGGKILVPIPSPELI